MGSSPTGGNPSGSGPVQAVYDLNPPEGAHLWEYVHVVLRRRRLVLAVAVGIFALATLRSFLTRPVYEGTAQVLIERADPNVLSFKEVAQIDAARDDYYQTQYKLLQSRSLARRVLVSMNLLNDPEFGGPRDKQAIEAMVAAAEGTDPALEAAIGGFLGRLRVAPIRNSRLVNVSFASGRPELAAAVTNRLCETYIQQALDMRFQTSNEAGHWLESQIAQQRQTLENLDVKMQELKRREGIVNIDERRTLLEQRLKELGTALNERKTERLQKEALWRQMASASNPEELPEVMRSALVQSLRIELANLERQQAQLLQRYLDEHPEVVKVRNQIDETRRKISAESQRVIRAAENDYKAAQAQEASVSSALEAAKLETLDLSTRGVGYDSQKREFDAAKTVLDSLVSRAKETDVAQDLKATNIRIVDRAVVPRGPIRPRKLRDMLLGLVLGAMMSVGLAFFLEYLDNTVKTPDDVRQRLGVPLLGVVPEQATDEEPVLPHTEAVFSEAYRVVRTALNYSWPEKHPRIVLVTSTAPGEGKTLTSVNLALTLAASSGRVLLIDADLRKARVHQLLRASRGPGLSDVLVGKAKPSAAIQRLSPSHLNLLTAGTSVPSPADLMTTHTVKGLLDGLRKIYDWVVIDSPPVGAVAEPLILAPLCDGAVVVVGAEMVPRKAVGHTLERVVDAGSRILGVVLNRAQTEKHSYYYSHYYGHYYSRYYGRKDEGKDERKDGRKPRSASVSKIDEKRSARG